MNTIISVTLNDRGELEVVRRYPSPDRVVKEIYRAENQRIVLADVIEGRHTPACFDNFGFMVDERIEFPE